MKWLCGWIELIFCKLHFLNLILNLSLTKWYPSNIVILFFNSLLSFSINLILLFNSLLLFSINSILLFNLLFSSLISFISFINFSINSFDILFLFFIINSTLG